MDDLTPEQAYQRAYHAKNRAARNAQSRAYCKAHAAEHRSRNRKYEAGTRANQYRADPAAYLWKVAKARAKKLEIEFTITPADIVVPERCPVLGVRISVLNRAADQDGASLDRIDNTKGYVPGNVAVLSRRGNRTKGDLTPETIKAIVAYMQEHGAWR